MSAASRPERIRHRWFDRTRAVLAVVATTSAIALLGAGTSAGAATLAYPPTPCSALSASTTVPAQGGDITIHGSNFTPHASVGLSLQSTGQVLASAMSNAAGAFTAVVHLPDNLTGPQVIVATSGQSAGCAQPTLAIRIHAIAASTSHAPGGSGGTSSTGFDVLAFVLLGVVLIAVGLVLNIAWRRRIAGSKTHG
jgi:hypothetical protein